jgi:glycosyltransferase involved in cell wall biosynthesis
MPNPEPPSISAVVLTLNEAETVAAAIKSLSWCDEVFVVDSDSQDKTREISSSLGATVAVHKQDGVFLISEQRNWAIANLPIKSDWVLFLDADEESTPSFQAAVNQALKEPESYTAFYAAPAFIYYGKWLKRISGYPNWHPRIVLVESTTRFTGGVWEDFSHPAQAGQISKPYIHRTNAKGLSDWVEKHVRYAAWEGQGIRKQRSGEAASLRRAALRRIRYSLGPFRKYIAILYLAIIRGGVLDGRQGLSYLRRMFIYELLIDESLKEQMAKELKGDL